LSASIYPPTRIRTHVTPSPPRPSHRRHLPADGVDPRAVCRPRRRRLRPGPQGPLLSATPQAAIGFIEAHGLAAILGALLWRAAPARAWHLTAAAVHALLGGANIAFWRFFAAADMVAVGWATTLMHSLFVLLQLYAVFDEHCSTLREA